MVASEYAKEDFMVTVPLLATLAAVSLGKSLLWIAIVVVLVLLFMRRRSRHAA